MLEQFSQRPTAAFAKSGWSVKRGSHRITGLRTLLESGELRVPTRLLLRAQFDVFGFRRYDLWVRLRAAKEALSSETLEGRAEGLYRAMQLRRVGRDTWSDFQALMHRVKAEGLRTQDYPLTVDRFGRLLDGAHRFALALAYEIPWVTIKVSRRRNPRSYSRRWFKKVGKDVFFNELHHFDVIEAGVFIASGVITVGIVGPDALPRLREILRVIRRRATVIASEVVMLSCTGEDFLRELSLVDELAGLQVELSSQANPAGDRARLAIVMFVEPDDTLGQQTGEQVGPARAGSRLRSDFVGRLMYVERVRDGSSLLAKLFAKYGLDLASIAVGSRGYEVMGEPTRSGGCLSQHRVNTARRRGPHD